MGCGSADPGEPADGGVELLELLQDAGEPHVRHRERRVQLDAPRAVLGRSGEGAGRPGAGRHDDHKWCVCTQGLRETEGL